MYVCICKAVTDKQIQRAAAAGCEELYDLQDSLGVALYCGSCAELAESILQEAQERSGDASPAMYVPSPA
jgi:bacterioferritin-associated ferredoxin